MPTESLLLLLVLISNSAALPSEQAHQQETVNPSSSSGHLVHTFPSPLRQDKFVCKDKSTSCPASHLCCPGFCCPSHTPFCAIPSSALCLDLSGKTSCISHVSDESVLGTPCLSAPGKLCCARPGFDRCSAAPPFVCVSATGFVSCGEKESPGVLCPDRNKCCRNPLRCCGEGQCCEEGDGGPVKVEPLYLKTPAAAPEGSSSTQEGQAQGAGNAIPGAEETPIVDAVDVKPTPEAKPSESGFPNGSVASGESLGEESSEAPSQSASSPALQAPEMSASPLPFSSDLPPPPPPSSDLPPPSLSDFPYVSASDFPPDGGVVEFPQDTPTTDNGRACFPSNSTVELQDGRVKTMEDLRTGEKVRVGAGKFSEVFMWTHRDGRFEGNWYVTLFMEGGATFTATMGHFVYVCRNREVGCRREVFSVERVRVGDSVWLVAGGKEETTVSVTSVVRTSSRGLYNPQTLHGDIVVDSVVVTCYTKLASLLTAHGSLAPLRAFRRLIQFVSGQ